jgi:hypothetical protein
MTVYLSLPPSLSLSPPYLLPSLSPPSPLSPPPISLAPSPSLVLPLSPPPSHSFAGSLWVGGEEKQGQGGSNTGGGGGGRQALCLSPSIERVWLASPPYVREKKRQRQRQREMHSNRDRERYMGEISLLQTRTGSALAAGGDTTRGARLIVRRRLGYGGPRLDVTRPPPGRRARPCQPPAGPTAPRSCPDARGGRRSSRAESGNV